MDESIPEIRNELLDYSRSSTFKKNDDFKNHSRMLQLSLTFFLLFCAFYTCQNLATTVIDADGLGSFGFYTLAALYGTLIISSFSSTAFMNKVGLYKCLFIGSLCHFAFVFANIMPAVYADYPSLRSGFLSLTTIKVVLVVSAMLNGFGAGILWCSEGTYTSQCATERSKGYFFGLFWFFFMGSMVGGSLLGALILSQGFKQTWLYVTLAVMALTASLLFLLIRRPLPHQ